MVTLVAYVEMERLKVDGMLVNGKYLNNFLCIYIVMYFRWGKSMLWNASEFLFRPKDKLEKNIFQITFNPFKLFLYAVCIKFLLAFNQKKTFQSFWGVIFIQSSREKEKQIKKSFYFHCRAELSWVGGRKMQTAVAT